MKQNGSLHPAKMTIINLGGWIAENRANLLGKTEYPTIEINAIAAHVLQKSTSWVIGHPETILNIDQLQVLNGGVKRLLTGEPLAYITGTRSFFGLDFFIDQRVLVPRPETELLVEHAIGWLDEHPGRHTIADLGTGSGIIAISLAKHYPDLKVTAVDLSSAALEVARMNADFHQVADRIKFFEGDLLEGQDERYDMILANLPYIPSSVLETLKVVEFEPRLALDGGADGLFLFTKLFDQIPERIAPGGFTILEIQYNQDKAVSEIVTRKIPNAIVRIHKDLASLPRIITIGC